LIKNFVLEILLLVADSFIGDLFIISRNNGNRAVPTFMTGWGNFLKAISIGQGGGGQNLRV